MKKRKLFFCLSLACMLPIHIYGAKPIDTQAQLDRAREQQLAREARLGEGRITVQTGGIDITSGSFDFYIRIITLIVFLIYKVLLTNIFGM